MYDKCIPVCSAQQVSLNVALCKTFLYSDYFSVVIFTVTSGDENLCLDSWVGQKLVLFS